MPAALKTMALVLWLRWVVVLLLGALMAFGTASDTGFIVVLSLGFGFGYMVDMGLCLFIPARILEDFRKYGALPGGQ